jgi:carboxypeptidase Taq
MHTDSAWSELEQRVRELAELGGVSVLLGWDQQTQMPPAGAPGRARAAAAIRVVRHRRLVDPRLGELVEQLTSNGRDPAQAAILRIVARNHRRAARLPDDLVRRLSVAGTLGHDAWQRARRDRDFAAFRPYLEEIVGLKREQADLLGHDGEPYDPLLDGYEPDMRTARLVPLFAELREQIGELLEALAGSDQAPPPLPHLDISDEAQLRLSRRLLADVGFDLQAGRLDCSAHPFSSMVGLRDVRVTTRLDPHDPFPAVFSTIHEAGHGMYDQGFDARYEDLPVADAPSLGAHESQSRLWENIVGRSRPFWGCYTPVLRELLGSDLGGWDAEQVYRHVNRVAPSLIRVDSDEVTYNLHILIRFELELALLHGDLAVADLPEAWNDAYRRQLGIQPPHDGDGVLQDVHWSEGAFGYFPTYTLGNLYSAMLWARLRADLPDVEDDIAAGRFAPILGWLREKVHARGHLLECEPLMREVTGSGLTIQPFMDYLWAKMGPLYGISRPPAVG